MKYRIHQRVETKPDGRKIYYYTFEPAKTQEREVPSDEPTSNASVAPNSNGNPYEKM